MIQTTKIKKLQWWIKIFLWPWPAWLSWLGILPQGERLPVQFPVRAHAWVAGLVSGWGTCERQPVDVSLTHWCFYLSLSPSLPLSLKMSKIFLKNIFMGGSIQMRKEVIATFALYVYGMFYIRCFNEVQFTLYSTASVLCSNFLLKITIQ